MKEITYFAETPEPIEIMRREDDGLADIRMRRNIIETASEEEASTPTIQAEEVYFAIPIEDAPDAETIQADWDKWWKFGAGYGAAGDAARAERTRLLAETDYLVALDYPISDADRAAVITYRQALRDITDQPEFPSVIYWPAKPEIHAGGESMEQIIEQIVGEG
jgi:hypothetical protein